MITEPYTSESKPNGFTKKCRDCGKTIYLHRGTTDRWRAFEPGEQPDEWSRHRCPAGLQDADMLSLIAPAGAKRDDLVHTLRRLIADFEVMIKQAEATAAANAAAAATAAANAAEAKAAANAAEAKTAATK
ncbi:MAG TPA: hypothetical protein VGD27_09825 [Longimicrobiales bacterium]